MVRIKNVEKNVLDVLRRNEKARDDDFILLAEIYHIYCPQINQLTFDEIMLHHDKLGLPYFESVRRTRAKLQAEHQELKPSKAIQEFRKASEITFKEYSLS